MNLLCYRGVFHLRIHKLIKPTLIEQSPSVPRSARVLCYRGVSYLQATCAAPDLEPTNLQIAQYNPVQLEQSNRRSTMQAERMGYLYKFYCIGWRNGSIKHFPQLQHWLLSLFFYYRRGFAQGAQWRQDQTSQF